MATFPTLTSGRLPSITSVLNQNVQLLRSRFGSGFSQNSPAGLKNIILDYTITFDDLDDTDSDQLQSFLEANTAGQTVTIPLYHIDKSGATTADFVITFFSRNSGSAGHLNNWSITADEVVT
jgi:hypothetical protein